MSLSRQLAQPAPDQLGNIGAVAEFLHGDGNRLAGLSLSAEELSETAKKISGFIARPTSAVVAVKEPVETVEEPGSSTPVYKKWWFWTAVGVVAVGGATTAGVVAANNSGGRPFNVVLGIP